MIPSLTFWRTFEKNSAQSVRNLVEYWRVSRRLYARLHTRLLQRALQERMRQVPVRLRSDPTYLAFYLALEDVHIRSRLHAPMWYRFGTEEVEELLRRSLECSPEVAEAAARLFRSEQDTESLSDFFSESTLERTLSQ